MKITEIAAHSHYMNWRTTWITGLNEPPVTLKQEKGILIFVSSVSVKFCSAN